MQTTILSSYPSSTSPRYRFDERGQEFCEEGEEGKLAYFKKVIIRYDGTAPLGMLPTLEKVEKCIQENFLNNNTLESIEDQREKTDGGCALRAHVFSLFLDTCDIPHKKIYKVWNSGQFKWVFHCVILITTDKKEKFIADFWEEKTLKLIPFKEWIIKREEPLPIDVLIRDSHQIDYYFDVSTHVPICHVVIMELKELVKQMFSSPFVLSSIERRLNALS